MIYRSLIKVSSLLMIGLGVVLIVRTLLEAHGFGVGVILGALFIAAGGGRMLLMRRTSGT